MQLEKWSASSNEPIDCFYVYPTVSTDTSTNSDLTADSAEINVVRQQFARFGSSCRLYAPMYRQVTLRGLGRLLAGPTENAVNALTQGTVYEDVREAWKYYLEHDNKGRGVVLIGHSQGAIVLTTLIAKEIDGKSVQSRIVSAILAGTTIAVPRGRDVGGTFKTIPLCRSNRQTGCVITFASYRSTKAPPAAAMFGRVADTTMVAACTNPAALQGGSGFLRPYFETRGRMIVGPRAPRAWVAPEVAVTTPLVTLPEFISAECTSNASASGYLSITVHAVPADPRTDDIPGETILLAWGLHMVDFNLAMGNLGDIIANQSAAYRGRRER